ncbi:MAG: glycosyltransferase [Burkholderiaceae bacterium]
MASHRDVKDDGLDGADTAPLEGEPGAGGATSSAAPRVLALAPGSVSIVVPVHNSATILPRLVERLEPVLRRTQRTVQGLILVNGSGGTRLGVVEEQARRHSWIRGIDLMRNYGQHNALLLRIRAARHAIVVTIDDDLQHPPEEIRRCSRSSRAATTRGLRRSGRGAARLPARRRLARHQDRAVAGDGGADRAQRQRVPCRAARARDAFATTATT